MGWGGQYVLILMIKTPKKDTNITSCMLSTVTINAFISCFSFLHAISILLWSEKIISSISNGNLSLLMAILCFARLNWLRCEIAFYVIYKLLNNNNLFTNSLCVFSQLAAHRWPNLIIWLYCRRSVTFISLLSQRWPNTKYW